jgi:hypothetical protein
MTKKNYFSIEDLIIRKNNRNIIKIIYSTNFLLLIFTFLFYKYMTFSFINMAISIPYCIILKYESTN